MLVLRLSASAQAWLMLLLFSALSFSNGFQWVVIASVAATLQAFFATTAFLINLQSMLFMIVFLACPLTAAITERRGLRFTIVAAAFFNALGAACRAVGGVNATLFPLVTFGTFLASVAQLGILAAPGLIAQRFFSAGWRPVATASAALANQLGVAVAFIATPFFVKQGSDFVRFQTGVSIVYALLLVVLWFVFVEEPLEPPSASEQLRRARKDATHAGLLTLGSAPNEPPVSPRSTRGSLKLLFRNLHFMLSASSFGLTTGVFYAWGTVIVQLTALFGISEADASLQGFAMIAVGLLGAVAVAIVLPRKKRSHGLLLKSSLWLGAASTGYWAAALILKWSIGHQYVAVSLFGVAMTAILPVAIELGTEVSHPVNSDLSAGIQLVAAQVFGIVLIVACTLMLDAGLGQATLLLLVAAGVVAAAVSMFIRVTYVRQELDAKAAAVD